MLTTLRRPVGWGFAAALATALLVVACEDTTPSSGGPAPPSPCITIVTCQGRGSTGTAPLPLGNIVRFAYVANADDNTVSMFLVDDATGRLAPIGYVLVGAAPVAVATDPSSKYLYVVNRDDDTISAFEIDENTGTLLELADSPYATGNEPVAVLVEPAGNFLYVANRAGQSITAFTIDDTDGSLISPTTTLTGGRSPTSFAVNSAGTLLFIGNSELGLSPASASSFSINPGTGTLAPIDAELVGDGALTITLHPGGVFLHAVTDTNGDVAVLSIAVDGSLTVEDTSTVTAGNGGAAIAFNPAGTSAYLINRVANTIQDYSVDVPSGALTAVITTPALDTGTSPVGLVVDPLGERAYVMNAGSADVSVFALNGTTGALTSASTTRAQQGPQSLAFVTRGESATAKAKFAYILNQGVSTISSYDVNSSGTLTVNGPQSLTGGLGTARALAVDPFARFAYVAHASNEISAYRINASTGALPPIDTVNAGAAPSVTVSVDPTTIAVEPSGRYAYAAGSSANGATGWQVIVLAIDQTTGALTEVTASGQDIGTLPVAMTVDPTGRFLYTVDSGSDAVSMFSVATATGLLTSAGAALSVNDDPRSVTIDGSGRFAYVVSAGVGTNQLQGFSVDAATGNLTPINSLTTGTNANPTAVAADPTGRFVYALNTSINTIRPFVIDLDVDLGELTSGTVSITGSGPAALAIEPGGRFVYVVNQVSSSANIFSINQTSGNLSAVGSIPSSTFSTPIAVGLTLLIE